MRFGLTCAAVLVLTAAGAAAGEPPTQAVAGPEAGKGAWIVGPRGYWRFHYTFRPAHSLGPNGQLKYLHYRYAVLNSVMTGNRLSTPLPPADWTGADFDDSAWCAGRAPLPIMPDMDQDGQGPYSCHVIRRFSARTRFLVADPAAVTRLRLDLRFHGGAIVYVNGREVGRASIPADGALSAEGYAEPYPMEAYRPKDSVGVGRDGYWSNGDPYQLWRWDSNPEEKARIVPVLERLNNEVRMRRIQVDVPRDVLRKGVNVLAVDNWLSPIPEHEYAPGKTRIPANCGRWPHIGIADIRLESEPDGSIASADLRPPGGQAWSEDIHRWMLEEDFLEPGVPPARVLRLAAPRNGACSAQAVIGTSQDLAALSASVSDLAGPGGAKIPASAAAVRWARSVALRQVKRMHGGTFHSYMLDRWLIRYRGAPADTWVAQWSDHWGKCRLLGTLWGKDTMQLHDQLSSKAPDRIAAGRSQPVWLTVEVPKDAAPGLYTGTLSLKAGGMDDARFDVRLQVFDYSLPAPREWTAYAGIDESPWALAKWANVPLWSEEHWKLVEQSIQRVGQLGARVVSVPVIHKTELNNDGDAMIKWVRRGEDSYDYEFSIVDRYLGLWQKHGHRQSDVIIYLVHTANEHGKGGGTGSVTLVDPATRQETAFTPPRADTPEGQKLWVDCAKAIHAHLKAKGIQDENMHWGLFYDYIGASSFALAEPLAQEIPTVGWARSSHEGRSIHGGTEVRKIRVSWNAAVRAEQKPPFSKDGKVTPLMGWTNATGRLLLARADSDVSALTVLPPLWQLREVQEMPVSSAYRGFARICADGWGRGTYFGPYNPWLVYPAPGGVMEGSVQFEVLREGLQEVEARIFLEKQPALPPDAQKVLDLRTERIWMIPPRPEGQRIGEYWAGWQESSWDLYAAAAQAAGGKAPSAEDRGRFFGAAGK